MGVSCSARCLLPSGNRAALAAKLLASLDEGDNDLASDAEWEAAWGEELERRADELHAGGSETVPADEVFADARRRRATRR